MAQFARPNSTTTLSGWTDDGGGSNLHLAIDEVTFSDSDFMQSDTSLPMPNPGSEMCVVELSDVADPELSTGHILRWRYRKSGGPEDIAIRLELRQGTSVIVTRNFGTISNSFTTDNFTLTSGQANSITDYNDLNIRVGGADTDEEEPNVRVQVSWAELEVPARALTLTADVGTFTWTGIAAGLVFGHTIIAALGTFTLTGIAIILAVVRLVVDTGVFTLRSHASILKANTGGEVEKFNTFLIVFESSPGFTTYGGGTIPANIKDDDPTTGIQTDTAGRFVRFSMNDVSEVTGSDTINFVTFYLKARKSGESGTGRFRLRILDSALSFTDGANLTQTTEYVYLSSRFNNAPAGGSWSVSELNSLLLQIIAISVPASQTIDAAEVFAEVDYTVAGAFTLNADTGAFALTGIAAGFSADRQLVAALGTFTLTGIATGLANGFVLPAALATFTLTGIAANLPTGKALPAALGTFTLTGLAATLTFTGVAAFTLTVDVGSFTLTGIATGLKADRQLPAALGTFTLTGIAVTLPTGKGLTADTGTFTLTGIAAGLKADRQLTAALGTFTLTGIAAALNFTGGIFTMVAALGTFALTGIATVFVFGRTIPATIAAFVLTGIAAGLAAGRQLVATVATFTLTGLAAGLAVGRQLVATVSAFLLTGIATGLAVGRALSAVVAAFILTGNVAGLAHGKTLVAALGTFTLTGLAVTLFHTGSGAFVLAAVVVAFVLTGVAIGLVTVRTLPPIVTLTQPGILNLTLTSPGVLNLNLKGGE